jgi:hypothetical protein
MEYEVKVPESLKAKGPKLGRPRNKAAIVETPAEAKPVAPKVALDSGRRRVRLRGANYALPCTVSCRGREISVVLQPNRWTDVPEEIYVMLRGKFGHVTEREVPDYRGDQRDPHPERANRMESPNTPIIEGL